MTTIICHPPSKLKTAWLSMFSPANGESPSRFTLHLTSLCSCFVVDMAPPTPMPRKTRAWPTWRTMQNDVTWRPAVQPRSNWKSWISHCSTMRKNFDSYMLSGWRSLTNQPSWLKTKKLQQIYWLLNPQVKIHSDMTLGHDINEVYEVSKEWLKEMLKEHEGHFHVTFNAWSTPNSHDYLGIVLVWCDKGQIRVVMLDLVEYVALRFTAWMYANFMLFSLD